MIRKVIRDKISAAGVDSITIERSASSCRVSIKVAKPGLVIGRGGKGIEELNRAIEAALRKIRKTGPPVNLNVEEIGRSDVSAAVIASQLAVDLEKRLPFRRTMKKYLDSMMQNRGVEGAKIRLSGRLDGNEIARREWLAKGKLPLTTLRANVDYSEATAFASYGTVGVKVWIYKGEL